jgi:hypothetical protein
MIESFERVRPNKHTCLGFAWAVPGSEVEAMQRFSTVLASDIYVMVAGRVPHPLCMQHSVVF